MSKEIDQESMASRETGERKAPHIWCAKRRTQSAHAAHEIRDKGSLGRARCARDMGNGAREEHVGGRHN